jgi:hypothetical protein
MDDNLTTSTPALQEAEEWVALARQRALFGGPHPLARAIAQLPVAEQDLIDRFLMSAAMRGSTSGGHLLEQLQGQALTRLGANPAAFLPTLLATLLAQARAASSATRTNSVATKTTRHRCHRPTPEP